jgi:hypothetical protein
MKSVPGLIVPPLLFIFPLNPSSESFSFIFKMFLVDKALLYLYEFYLAIGETPSKAI